MILTVAAVAALMRKMIFKRATSYWEMLRRKKSISEKKQHISCR